MGEERNTAKTPDTRETAEDGTVRLHTLDMLVANIIPTTKYFESRFDFLQHQINELREGQKRLEDLMDLRFGYVEKRFEQIDHRFEQVDRRFEQVDMRFEQVDARFNSLTEDLKEFKRDVDGRFQQVIAAIDRLSDKLDQRDEAQRRFTLKMFTIAISLSFLGVLGVFLKIAGVF